MVTWDGRGDGVNWSDRFNWSLDALPSADDDVRIEESGGGAIQHALGTDAIHSLYSAKPLTLSGGSLDVAATVQVDNTFTLKGGTLVHATILPGSGGQGITFTNSGGTLDGVTAASDLDLATNNSYLYVKNGLTLDNATVRLDNASGTT
jgi:hypothetical protein